MKFYSNKPSIPNKEDYQQLVESIFDSGFLTNFGQYHNDLLEKLKLRLNSKNIALCNNATTALACVIRSLTDPKKTNVITTPFTFSATCHSIFWANNPGKIEKNGKKTRNSVKKRQGNENLERQTH